MTINSSVSTSTSLKPFDVLSGRDKQSFNHVGNRRFRVVVSMNLQRYLDTKSRFERSEMILAFVRELRGDGGIRFIKRRGSRFIELNEKQSREKVGHALRDAAANARAQVTAGSDDTASKKKAAWASKSKSSKQNEGQQRQPQYQQLHLIDALSPMTIPVVSANNTSALVNDNEEFSISDDSLDSLLSLFDDDEQRHEQGLNSHCDPITSLMDPISFDTTFMMKKVDIDEEDFASF